MGNRVLVVEDNGLIAKLWCRKLVAAGYDVHAVSDGEEARRAMVEWSPRLVLLDVWLPGVDGLTLCEEWKSCAATTNVKVVFVSAFATRQDIEAALKVGGDGYIVKSPHTAMELVERVSQYLSVTAEPPMLRGGVV
jgi:two-component system response regulator RpaA